MSKAERSPKPWWDQLAAGPADFDIGGDVIIANFGTGARNVAVGKNIQQTVYETVGEPMPDDKAVIPGTVGPLQELARCRPVASRPVSDLQMLETELIKTGDDDIPAGMSSCRPEIS